MAVKNSFAIRWCRVIRTGIYQPLPSCWTWPPPGWKRPRDLEREPDRPDHANVLHRTFGQTTPGRPATVRSYRNTFKLLLRFVHGRTGKAPSALDWDDLPAEVVSAFLDHLETDRDNVARSRNARLAALRSLFRYAALRHPEHAQLIARVLAIPQKRYDKAIVAFLEPKEVEVLWPRPTEGAGKADGTTPSSPLPSRPAYGSPS